MTETKQEAIDRIEAILDLPMSPALRDGLLRLSMKQLELLRIDIRASLDHSHSRSDLNLQGE